MSSEIFTTLDGVQALIQAGRFPVFNATRHTELVEIYVRQCGIANDPSRVHFSGPKKDAYDQDPEFDDELDWIDQWVKIEEFNSMDIHEHGKIFYLY